jgi:hypothetical protein
VHKTKAVTIDPDAVRAWLRRPSDEDPDLTNAERLGVDAELTGRGPGGFLRDIRDVLAADPDGVHRRADITCVQLWLIPDGEVLHQGAVITVDLVNGIRLASLHQDIKDFAERGKLGVPAILTALDHIAAQVCLLVDRYEATRPDTAAPTDRPATAPTRPMFSAEAVQTAVNRAADDILDAVDASDTGLRDGLNLLVNAAVAYLTGEADDLPAVVAQGYDATYDEVLSWIEEAR